MMGTYMQIINYELIYKNNCHCGGGSLFVPKGFFIFVHIYMPIISYEWIYKYNWTCNQKDVVQ